MAIESSCDETGVALWASELGLVAEVLHSQVGVHAPYGGVVPELASRDHARRLPGLVRQAFAEAGWQTEEVDLVAYTAGPGLAGALLVGAAFAEAFAAAVNVPTLPIHHLEGHLLSPGITMDLVFPFLALLVSGGHTQLVWVEGVGNYEVLGETLDDAAGEAFDKAAKVLGLGYPGGARLASLAEEGDSRRFALPRPLRGSETVAFSFSGLKTAVALAARSLPADDRQGRADLAASFESAIVEVLVEKTMRAAELCSAERVVVAGGVAANRRLRTALTEALSASGRSVVFPPLRWCADNGAMVAYAAARRVANGAEGKRDGRAVVRPRWPLEALRG
ncbi:MAG: tRNA (adenosine(37)-N6)-threonylcarbamoyltransferase complex transferase subunit TsaD [Hydrogenophilus sp.]|nr:tRNA (adenosine(37)-N6)-threonylcarbamoyltransferase complex transferase subunit TsaD [Hydrogenophilus sp.]